MSLLPEVRDGVLVSIEIPYVPKKEKKISRRYQRRLNRIFKNAEKKRKNKKQKPKPFVTPKYKTYIKSPAWKARRLAFFKKYGKQCTVCGSRTRVGLHHISYRHVGRELDEELVALCWTHHEAYHEVEGVERENVSTHTFIEEERQVLEFREIAKHL